MYVDLLGSSQYIMANIKVMKIFGREVALYWAELLNIIPKVVKKKKYNVSTGFFTIDRSYIEDRTTLTVDEQYNCDMALSKAGILEEDADDKNLIRVHTETMVSLITEEDPKILKAISKQCKVTAKAAAANKKEAVIVTMQRLADDPDTDIKAKYDDWVEAVYANKRYLTKASVQLFQNSLNSYTTNKVTKIQLLDTAITHGWNDFNWVRSAFERNFNASKPMAVATNNSNDTNSTNQVGIKQDVFF
jgi:hypothetical protein